MTWWMLVMLLAQQAPSRDISGLPKFGTSVISGTVVSDDAEARPLRRVQVTLATSVIPFPRLALTDDAGRFVFTGIGSGNYTLQAARTGYVTTYYGGKKPGRGPGVPVAIVDGQNLSGVTFKMLRGAVISGVVRLPAGKPVGDLSVFASQVVTINGQRRADSGASVVRTGVTNDRGEYRIFGLAPGDYVVQVSPPEVSTGLRRMTPADIAAAQALLRPGAETSAGAPEPGPSVGFAPIYFPAATDMNSAETIALTAGQERGGVDLTLAFVPNSRLTGTVISPDGRPPQNIRLSLSSKRPNDLDVYYFGSYVGVSARPDGSFFASGITPGQYVLTARAASATDAPPPSPPGPGGASPPPSFSAPALTLWGSIELDINGQDLTGMVVRLQPGMTVSGKLIYDTTVPPLPDFTRIRIGLTAVTAPGASLQEANFLSLGSSNPTADGTFTMKGAVPGTYRITVSSQNAFPQPMPGVRWWSARSVMLNGRDVTDLPIQIKPGEDLADIVVTMTDQMTEVSGTVLDKLDRPTAGFPIVVFASDRTYWPAGDARVRKVQPASDGKYSILNLAAGEYDVCAVTDADANDLKDPAFLDSLAAASLKITVTPGQRQTLNLKLGGGGAR